MFRCPSVPSIVGVAGAVLAAISPVTIPALAQPSGSSRLVTSLQKAVLPKSAINGGLKGSQSHYLSADYRMFRITNCANAPERGFAQGEWQTFTSADGNYMVEICNYAFFAPGAAHSFFIRLNSATVRRHSSSVRLHGLGNEGVRIWGKTSDGFPGYFVKFRDRNVVSDVTVLPARAGGDPALSIARVEARALSHL